MRTYSHQLHHDARHERAFFIGGLIAGAIVATAQFISKAWRSSSSRGTNSNALS
jgi:hypothetical protein